jgi:hypothetical protein
LTSLPRNFKPFVVIFILRSFLTSLTEVFVKIGRFLAVLLLVISPPVLSLAAAGCPDGTAGNDNITCAVSPPTAGNRDNQIDTGLGNDIIVQAAGVTTLDIDADGQATPDLRGKGNGGNDTITNYGLVTRSIAGDYVIGNGGADKIINYGTVQQNIMGDEAQGAGGNDTISNRGVVGNTINGEGGNDIIINADNGNGGADHILYLDGGPGTDKLVFRYSSTTTYNQVKAALMGKSPASGSITINGQTFTWVNFEQIQNDAPAGAATPPPTRLPAPTATPAPTQTSSTTITVKISQAADDVNEMGATFYAGRTELWVGSMSGGINILGLRFASLNIPKGAVIRSAKLQFYSTTQQTSSANLTISGQAVGNNLTFSASSKPSQRTPLTSARLTTSATTTWAANTWYTLADVRPVVQEIIRLSAWQTGNPLTLILRGTQTVTNGKRVRAFEGGSATAARLVITYTR